MGGGVTSEFDVAPTSASRTTSKFSSSTFYFSDHNNVLSRARLT